MKSPEQDFSPEQEIGWTLVEVELFDPSTEEAFQECGIALIVDNEVKNVFYSQNAIAWVFPDFPHMNYFQFIHEGRSLACGGIDEEVVDMALFCGIPVNIRKNPDQSTIDWYMHVAGEDFVTDIDKFLNNLEQ